MTQKLLKKQTHGTWTSYNHGGCRCDKCREANKNYKQEVRGRNRKKYNEQMRKYYASKKSS